MDLQFGDQVKLKDDTIGIVFRVFESPAYGKKFCIVAEDDSIDHNFVYSTDVIEIRYPRVLEMIEVSHDHKTWVKRKYVDLDMHLCFPVRCIPEYEEVMTPTVKDTGTYGWKFWRLIDQREEKILDIIKQIESNDPVILRDMAEIILAAKETINKGGCE